MGDAENILIRALQRASQLSERGGTGLRSVTRIMRTPAFEKAIKSLGPSVLRKALEGVICGPKASLGLEELQQNGILHMMLPSVARMVGFGGGSQGHKDLWGHTKKVVEQADADPIIRWSALFHDVGKVRTFAVWDDRISFHGHEVQSSRDFRSFCRGSKFFSLEEEDRISQIIFYLGWVEAYESEWTDSAVRRLDKELGPILNDVIRLSRADITTGRDAKRERILRSIEALVQRVEKLRAEAAAPRLPKGLGLVLAERFSIPVGKSLGELISKLDILIKAGKIPAGSNVEDCAKYVEDHQDELLEQGELRTL